MRAISEFRAGGGVLLASLIGQVSRNVSMFGYTIGIFVIPLATEFGWSRRQILTAPTIITAGTVVASFAVGWLADRIRIANLIVFSQFCVGLSAILLGLLTHDLRGYYALFLVMALFGAAASPITFTKIISARFIKHRGLALGICMSGSGICGIILPPYIGAVVTKFGWRAGFIAIGLLPLLTGIPATLALLRKDVAAPGEGSAAATPVGYGSTFPDALRSLRFWMLIAALFLGGGAGIGIVIVMVPLLVEQGYTTAGAAGVVAIFGAAVICGRLLVGILADRFWAPMIAALLLVPAAVATMLLFSGTFSAIVVLVLIAIVGLAQGAEVDLLPLLTARYFGLRHYGKIFAFVFAIYTVGVGLSPPLIGYAYDVRHSYDLAIYCITAAWLGSGALFLMLGRYPNWQPKAA